jgi:hypothetical protein
MRYFPEYIGLASKRVDILGDLDIQPCPNVLLKQKQKQKKLIPYQQ